MEHAPIRDMDVEQSGRSGPYLPRNVICDTSCLYWAVFAHALVALCLSINATGHTGASSSTRHTTITASLYAPAKLPVPPSVTQARPVTDSGNLPASMPDKVPSAPSHSTPPDRLDALVEALSRQSAMQPEVVASLSVPHVAPVNVEQALARMPLPPEQTAVAMPSQWHDSAPAPGGEPDEQSLHGQVDPLLSYQLAIAEKIKSRLRVPVDEVSGCQVSLRLSSDGQVISAAQTGEKATSSCDKVVTAALHVSQIDMPQDPAVYRYLERLRVTVR